MWKAFIFLIKLKFILFTFFFSNYVLAQQDCYDNTHSVTVNDSWLSCNTSVNPNALRGTGHWIMYDLGYIYNLTTTHFWNYNVAGQQGQGIKDCIIDFSTDGSNWINATTFQLAQATGNSSYGGVSGPNLGGINARYVLLTASSSWGSSCAGLSEVRFDLGQQCSVNAQIVGLPAIISDNTPVNLSGVPAGGTFNGNGIIFSAFNPSLAGVGVHVIEYTYDDIQNNCTAIATQSVFVFSIDYNFVNYNLGVIAPKLNNELVLNLKVPIDDRYNIQLSDALGRPIYKEIFTFDEGAHNINITIDESFAKGVYFLTISNSHGSVNEKIIQPN